MNPSPEARSVADTEVLEDGAPVPQQSGASCSQRARELGDAGVTANALANPTVLRQGSGCGEVAEGARRQQAVPSRADGGVSGAD